MIKKETRILFLDELRGFAVFCMVFFHMFVIFYYSFDMMWAKKLLLFFLPAQPFFAGLFILICGICSRLSHNNLLRGFELLILALAFSFVTIVILPYFSINDAQIYFGILHLLSCSVILFSVFRFLLDKINYIIGIVVFLILFIATYNIMNGELGFNSLLVYKIPNHILEIKWLFPFGIMYYGFYSADYFPLIPWLFLFIVGTYLGVCVKNGKIPNWTYNSHVPFLIFLGQKALIIYIIHMPVIYILGCIIKFLIK